MTQNPAWSDDRNPSAALCADELAQNCDFLSIGTNDLVQYTLAADRNNDALTPWYQTHHPAVLKLLRLTPAAAKAPEASLHLRRDGFPYPVSALLIGLGFTELSVGALAWLNCKSIIRRCDARLTELVQSADLDSLGEIETSFTTF